MEAILDRLPLPRSRPAWMAAFLLAFIVSLSFTPFQSWVIRLERNHYYGDCLPIFKDDPVELKNVGIVFTLPRFISTDASYTFSATIYNYRDTPIIIDDLYVDVLLPVPQIDKSGNLLEAPGPVILSKSIGEQVLPRKIMPGQALSIASVISPDEFSGVSSLINRGIFLNFSLSSNGIYYQLTGKGRDFVAEVQSDQRQDLIYRVVTNILGTEQIYWIILGISLFSCWIIEEKDFQELWLNDRRGWKAVFSILLKGLGIFLGVLALAGLVILFNRFAAIIIIILGIIVALWIFGFTPKSFRTQVRK
jgi:hypothetical protein